MNNNLQHHGIKGQKWGVRRFQNKDGSLTAKGKKRYNDDDDGVIKVKKNTIADVKAKVGWEGPLPKLGELADLKKNDPEKYAKYQEYRKHMNNAINSVEQPQKNKRSMNVDIDKFGKATNNAKNLYDQYEETLRTAAKSHAAKEAKAKISYDLSQMSDEELKTVVNRLNMEERYTQVMFSRHVASGKSFSEKLLDGAGTALVLGTSALALAEQIKKLKVK